ncbi:MAG: hypothetical protein KUG77_07685 [Nannocystaceae bacterium]|nr:hypothetical protein [Nannocystaceae bacterium]
MTKGSRQRPPGGTFAWTRSLFGLAVAGPALALGGVHPRVLAAWIVLVGVLLLRLSTQSALRCPRITWVLLGLAGWTALAALPVPGIRAWAAPTLASWVAEALGPSGIAAAPGMSVRPADSLVEAVRLVGLGGLALAAGQLTWRLSALAVTVSGVLVAGVGFAHALTGATKIFGLYTPLHTNLEARTALVGTFINPNHQSGLLLLALFAAAALALDQFHGSRTARDASKVDQRRDRSIALLGAIALLLSALLLSLSRGALLAFVLTGPIGLVVALRGRPASRSSSSTPPRKAPLLIGATAIATVTIVIGRHGAGAELLTLLDNPATTWGEKLGPTLDAAGLIGRSPILGTGRGTFIDLFPLHAPGASRLYTHLESTPMTMLVEWGVFVGSIAIAAALGWWFRTLRTQTTPRERRPRILLLLGIAALGLQSLGDFSLEFIGVGAPLAALVGALSRHTGPELHKRRVAIVASSLGILGATAILLVAPQTWIHQSATDRDAVTDEAARQRSMWWRPLSGELHVLTARHALARGDTGSAEHHAAFGARTRETSLDARLVLAEVYARRGDPIESDRALTEALDRLRSPAPASLVAYVLAHSRAPASSATITPQRRRPFSLVVRALREAGAIDHADAMAQSRIATHPHDPTPLLVRGQIAAERRSPGLALHFALLARATDPTSGAAHLAVAQATAIHHDITRALQSLDEVPMATLSRREFGRLRELRVRLLLRRDRGEDSALALALAQDLLMHSDDEAARSVRRELVRIASQAAMRPTQ